MRLSRLTPLVPLALFTTAVACGSVPDDPGDRLFVPGGIIRGTVLYQGPRPCSQDGHIVGNAILLVFDRRNPPPPAGLATTAVNFATVTGDRLFQNEPRYTGSEKYCPADHGFTETVTVSAPFEVGPQPAGSYMLEAFYDYTGDFLPTFKFRNLPEKGDIAGGYIDTADALKPINAGNPNYSPKFLPIDLGTPQTLPTFDKPAPPNPIPNYTMPSSGFVADNITVSIGMALPIPRPYFYPQGGSATVDTNYNMTVTFGTNDRSSDAPATAPVAGALEDPNDPLALHYQPILTIAQDIQVLAGPKPTTDPTAAKEEANLFESTLPHLKLVGGLPKLDGFKFNEQAAAIAPQGPFLFQLPPAGGTFFVWQNAVFYPNADPMKYPTGYVPQYIPEGQVPYLWPLVVLSKLADEAPPVCDANGICNYHTQDPANLTAQGDATHPVIILQGITLLGTQTPTSGSQPESIFWSGADASPLGVSLLGATPLFDSSGQPVKFAQDHVTAVVRPSVICFDSLFDATNPDKRGTLVTPYLTGPSADIPSDPMGHIVPQDLLTNTDPTISSVANLVKAVQPACLPTGRYAINLVYPDGQAWTVPNETGACSGSEGSTNYQDTPITCTVKQRTVLYSQGPRAVVEIIPAKDPTACSGAPGKLQPVPSACLPVGP